MSGFVRIKNATRTGTLAPSVNLNTIATDDSLLRVGIGMTAEYVDVKVSALAEALQALDLPGLTVEYQKPLIALPAKDGYYVAASLGELTASARIFRRLDSHWAELWSDGAKAVSADRLMYLSNGWGGLVPLVKGEPNNG